MPKWRALPLRNPVGGQDLWVRTNVPTSNLLTEVRARRTYEHNRVQELTAAMPVGYTYQADVYCAGCILYAVGGGFAGKPFVYRTLEQWADARGIRTRDESTGQVDEYLWDSGRWPKPIYPSQIEREGFPECCGRCWCYFGMDPNEVGWCEGCEDFWPKCRCR